MYINKALLTISAAALAQGVIAQQRPNVVIIMTDQQRADLCKREGFPLDVTPFADSLAHSNAWFNNAFTSTPASSPARSSMLTGRYPSATRVRTNHNLRDIIYEKDMLDVFRDAGYKLALVGKNHAYVKASDFDYYEDYIHWGKIRKDTPEDKAFAHWLDEDAKGQYLEPSPFPVEQQNPVQIVNKAINWIDNNSEQPFFMWLSFPEPHNPFQISEPYYSMFSPEMLPEPTSTRKNLKNKGPKYETLSKLEDQSCPDLQKDLPRLKCNYLGMMRLIDDQMKRFVDDLKQKSIYENTIIIILSDHGDYFGEYGLIRKGAGVSDCLTKIPMIWTGPGIKNYSKGLNDFVSITDIFPTLCSAIDAEIPLGVQGRSLWPMLTGQDYPKEQFESIMVEQGFGGLDFGEEEDLTFAQEGCLEEGKISHFDELNTWSQSGSIKMVRKGDFKLIADANGNFEMYQLSKDPAELNNLFENGKYRKTKEDLLKCFVTWTLQLQDPLPTPHHRYKFKRTKYNWR